MTATLHTPADAPAEVVDDEPTTAARPASRALRLVLLALLTLLGAVLVLVVAVPRVLGLVPLTILSGSMEPTLPVGSQVFVDPVESVEQAREEITVGSIITVMPRPDDPTLVTHRVVAVEQDVSGRPVWTTKGDANGGVDDWEVTQTQLRGVVRYHVPWVGYVASSMTQTDKDTVVRWSAGALFVYAAYQLLAAWRGRHRGGRHAA